MFRFTEPSSGKIQNTVLVHLAHLHTMGSHTHVGELLVLIANIRCVIC